MAKPKRTAQAAAPDIPIPSFRFSGTWRGYQQRLLDEMAHHLDDRRLHVVAAPGAGKTLLGLEVLRLLGRPALVLSPTLGIREQWLARLRAMYVGDAPDWLDGVGSALAKPGWLTSSTYQSVHAALGGKPDAEDEDEAGEHPDAAEEDEVPGPDDLAVIEEKDALPGLLKALTEAGVATLVLDEAHHLRRAWWESLQVLVKHLRTTRPDFHIVALTATPPYDVDDAEWQRYAEVCGPIDAEISIPELVRAGDLCPHQDFIHLGFPRPQEIGAFETFAVEAEALAGRWCRNPALAAMVRAHPWLRAPDEHADAALARPELLAALLIVAEQNDIGGLRAACGLIGAREDAAPEPTARALASLFQAVLDQAAGDEAFALAEADHAALVAELRAIGALWRGKVRLHKDEHLARALTRSAGKIDGAIDIAMAEHAALGPNLRMVILADYIRAEALRRPEDRSTDRLGAGTLFRRLVAAGFTDAMETAMVTGSTVVVPARLEPALREEAERMGLAADALSLRPLPDLPDWRLLDMPAADRARRLILVTHLFEAGTLKCLVGTGALLGEGWDAPSINSLILATSVKAFMLSNQMRGRAIRRNPARPQKAAAIWHLATIIPPEMVLARDQRPAWQRVLSAAERPRAHGILELDPNRLGRDARLVAQRFKTFAGVTHEAPYQVRSSIARLGLRFHTWTAATVAEVNREMLARAADRAGIATAWGQAVGHAMRMERPVAGVDTEPPPGALSYVWSMGVAALLAPLLIWVAYLVLYYPQLAQEMGQGAAFLAGLAVLAVAVGWNWRRIWRLVAAGSPGRHLREIGQAVLDGLAVADRLHTPRAGLTVTVLDFGTAGARYCAVSGGTQHDEATFAEAFAELMEPIQNPRHVLTRRAGLWLVRQVDYHAVPSAISADETALAAFRRGWQRRIGACEIHGTRSRIGRRRLLQARARQYAGAFLRRADKLTVWE